MGLMQKQQIARKTDAPLLRGASEIAFIWAFYQKFPV